MAYPVLRYRSPRRTEDFARPADRRNPQPPGRRLPLLSEERLLCHAGVPRAMLESVRATALRWGVSLRRASIADGLTTPQAEADALAWMCGLRNIGREPIALRPVWPAPEPHRLLKSRALLPLAGGEAEAVLNAAAFTADQLADFAAALGPARHRVAVADKATLTRAIAAAYGPALAEDAANSLAQRRPRLSAAHGIARWQGVFLILAAGLFTGAALFVPREAIAISSVALSLVFLLTIGMRLMAAWQTGLSHLGDRAPPQRRPRGHELPNYTVLVAMYREAKVLPELVEGLKALNYPSAKLDIKLVLEEDDHDTIEAARGLCLPPHFEIVVVPDGKPRTKPRALNYALRFATGDLLVIYDAEDRPEPDQLMKAAVHFRRAPREVVCLQARLTFDNAAENWLAKQFTIEYASLFGGILPMLDRAKLPLPLGGTSNHFRVAALRAAGGWDAHNVTEDADLGLRLYRCGLRAQMLDSVTYEEACCQLWPWLKQRTRWLKGWIQTYGVHMREPVRLLRELGLGGFLSLQGHFAGVIIAALVHPLSYVIIFHDALTGVIFDPAETMLGRNLWLLALFNLLGGYLASLALGLFALKGKRLRQLVPHLVLIPFYWLLLSAACYRAVCQLVTAPHYWEKTEHGLSKFRRSLRRPEALAKSGNARELAADL